MAPSIPRYNNLWEELFPSPDMSRNPDVRSGKRKKMVGPLHVNRWGPNKEAWGKIGRFILGLPSQEEIEKYAKIRNNRVNNTQQPVELPPAAQNSLYDSQGRNVFDGTTLKGENERKAELISNANKTSLASKVNSEETPNSSDPQTAGSTVFTKDKEGKALGVMTRNQRKNWEAENANWQSWQPEGKGYTMSSVLKDDGSISSNKDIDKSFKPLSKAEFEAAGYNLTDRQIEAKAAGIELPKGVKPGTALEWNTDQSLTASPTISNIQSLPKAEQLTKLKAFDGTNAGLVQGLKGVGTIASALQAVFNKKKKPSTAGMEDKGRGIEQVLVASGNNNTEDFYDSLFG